MRPAMIIILKPLFLYPSSYIFAGVSGDHILVKSKINSDMVGRFTLFLFVSICLFSSSALLAGEND